MKLKASKKEIRENSYYVLSIGYCNAQYLLKAFEPFAYSCGYYGWSCDYYEITTNKHRLIISTGYSPISSQNLPKKDYYEIIRKYDEKARAICCKPQGWEKTKKQLINLCYKFIDNEVFTNEEQ